MNYLAHIHLAHVTGTSLLGNFLGDFVKGSDLSHLSLDVQKGIILHRAIDTFTDKHCLVRELKKSFPNNIRRTSGIVIDIYFDYLLCQNWHNYHAMPMQLVLDDFYRDLARSDLEISDRFANVKEGLLRHQWLHEYSQKESVYRAFVQIEERLGRRIIFADPSLDFIEQSTPLFTCAFDEFYPLLNSFCHRQCR